MNNGAITIRPERDSDIITIHAHPMESSSRLPQAGATPNRTCEGRSDCDFRTCCLCEFCRTAW
jgi:hypothetical protein